MHCRTPRTRRLSDFVRQLSLVRQYGTAVLFAKSNLAGTMAAAMVAMYRTFEFIGVMLQIILLWQLSRGGMWRIYEGFSVSTGGRKIE